MITFLIVSSFVLILIISMRGSYNRFMAMDITGSSYSNGKIWTEKQIRVDPPETPKIGEVKKCKWGGGKILYYRWTSENSFLFYRHISLFS